MFRKRAFLVGLGALGLAAIAASLVVFAFRRPISYTQEQNIVIQNSEASLAITAQPGDSLCPFTSDLRDMSWEEMIAEPPVSSGLGYAMFESDISGATAIGYNTFQIEAQTAIRGTFHLFYPETEANSNPVQLRYVVFLDEYQINAFQDENVTSYPLTLQPGEEASISLNLPPLSDGMHDLIVLGIVEAELNEYGSVTILPYRATLIVGDTTEYADQMYALLQPDAYKSGSDGFFPLNVHSDETQLVWTYPDVYRRVQDELSFYVSVGYMENTSRLANSAIFPQPSPFAILTLLNWEQVTGTSQNPFYAAVSPNNLYSFIPYSLDVSSYQGFGELLVLRVNYPRFPMCWLRGTGGYQFDNGVYGNRVGIEFVQ